MKTYVLKFMIPADIVYAVVFDGTVKAGQKYGADWNANANGCGKDKYYYYRYTSSKGVDTGRLVRK